MSRANPRPLGAANRHYWRALEMAGATGADLQSAFALGVITQDDWAGCVQRCRACGWDTGCKAWLATQENGMAALPEACPNDGLFARVIASLPAGEIAASDAPPP